MPMDPNRYPDDWDERARQAKDEAGWKCQKCGIANLEDGTMGSCLTVHHPDRDPENRHARLEVLCARCHLKDEAVRRRLELLAEQEKTQLILPFKEGIIQLTPEQLDQRLEDLVDHFVGVEAAANEMDDV